jgi:hypothetical protein
MIKLLIEKLEIFKTKHTEYHDTLYTIISKLQQLLIKIGK